MPTAPQLDWPQGQPLFEVQLRAVAEGLAGNGVVDPGDLEVTATATDLEIEVAAGTAYYDASEVALTAAETHTLSSGDADYDRWDTVVFDAGTASSAVREGTAEQYPTPPDISGDELLLAIVYVPSGATDVSDSEILDWRAQFSNEAEQTHYDDTTGTYGVATVDAALDELQEAAQAGAYPFEAGDLNPISASPIPIDDLATPYGLDDLTDTDLGDGDLTAGDGATTVWDAAAGQIPRPQIDQSKVVSTVTSSTYTTADEEVVLVDTAAIGATSTITLASSDAVSGNEVVVVDLTGSAETYPITVDTGGETINGGSSVTIETAYGAQVFVSDGSNWVTAGGGSGGGYDRTTDFDVAQGQDGLAAGDQLIVGETELADGATLELVTARLSGGAGQPPASSVTLDLVTFDGSGGYTSQTELFAGDGSTVFDASGSPLASYSNSSGGAQQVGVLVDNGNSSAQDVYAAAKGVIV